MTAVLQYTEARYGVRVAVVTVASTKGVKAGTYANQLLDRDYKDSQNSVWSCSWPWTAMTGMLRQTRP